MSQRRPRRSPSVVLTETTDGVLVLDTRTSELLLLRRDAGLLLAQLDGAATLDELVEDAADGSDADAVRAWLLATLDGLRDAGLLAGDP